MHSSTPRAVFSLLILVLLVSGAHPVPADVGTEFWLTFPFESTLPDLALDLVLMSEVDTVVTIGSPYFATIPVVAGVATRVPIPPAAVPLPNLTIGDAVHVSAPDPFMVTAVGAGSGSVGSFRIKPESQLGMSYLVVTYPSDGAVGGSAFAVVATQDATTATVTTTVSTVGIPAGVPVQVNLNRGDTIFVLASGSFGDDLTGSSVVADAPVAVFAANTCAYIPLPNPGFCDQTVEQLSPTTRFGTEVVAVPSSGRPAVLDQLRVAAIEDGTVITWDPPQAGAPSLLNAGEVAEVSITEAVHIAASLPIEVARYSISSVATGTGEPGDASQIEVRPTTEFGSRHTFYIDNFGSGGAEEYWAEIVTTGTGCVLLDGQHVPPTFFSPIGAGPFLSASLSVGAGRHVVETDPVAAVTVSGFADWEGNGTTAVGQLVAIDCGLFYDGFESGGTDMWSSTAP